MQASDPSRNLAELQHRRDPLTGAFDRGAFDLIIQSEIERALLQGTHLSLCVFDLDHFKSINDAYGHSRGDAVLRELVRRVSQLIRDSDRFFRYGGDEFVLLLPSADAHQAAMLAGRLLDGIHSTPMPGEPPLAITLSVGVATLPMDGTTVTEIFQAADSRTACKTSGPRAGCHKRHSYSAALHVR